MSPFSLIAHFDQSLPKLLPNLSGCICIGGYENSSSWYFVQWQNRENFMLAGLSGIRKHHIHSKD
jgi:hypothetical protein